MLGEIEHVFCDLGVLDLVENGAALDRRETTGLRSGDLSEPQPRRRAAVPPLGFGTLRDWPLLHL